MQCLYVPDLHLPYEHPDAYDFIVELQRTYKPELTIQTGDVVDLHHQSFHDKHPELKGPRDEFEAAREKMADYCALFDVVTRGNHGLRPERVAQKMGLLPEMVTDPNTLWGVDTYFCAEYWTGSDQGDIVCRHGDGGFPKYGSPARRYTHNTVTGHHHTLAGVQHYTLMDGTRRWMASAGALIDPASPAFSYTPHKPVLGALVIHEDVPLYEPMKLDRWGRWVGHL